MRDCPTCRRTRAPSCGSSARPSRRTRTKPREIREPAVRGSELPNASAKESPHDTLIARPSLSWRICMKQRRWLPLVMPVLWLAVLGSAVQVIYARHKARDMFVHLERLNAERDSLDMEWGRLQLEQSYWSSNAFVERVANAKLQMSLPQTRDVRIVRQ